MVRMSTDLDGWVNPVAAFLTTRLNVGLKEYLDFQHRVVDQSDDFIVYR